MNTRTSIFLGVVIFGALLLFLFLGKGAPEEKNAQPLLFEEQTVSGGGVDISVMPQNITADADMWSFQVVLNTHSVELSEDIAAVSALLDDRGTAYEPFSWEEGSLPAGRQAPGGHHRSGILKFKPISPMPDSITLVLNTIGGVAERKFSWRLR